jgi:hypothetical protein
MNPRQGEAGDPIPASQDILIYGDNEGNNRDNYASFCSNRDQEKTPPDNTMTLEFAPTISPFSVSINPGHRSRTIQK